MRLIAATTVVAVLGGGSLAAAVETEVRPWRPAGVSSPGFESHAAFDPRTGDLYFVRSSPQFTGWRILVSRCTGTGWSTPEPPAFAGDGVEADPYFTPDGRTLYFISTRSVDGVKRRDLDIWRVDRKDSGSWGAPMRLPEPVNSPGAEWFPRPGADGWLYFGSDRPGGVGKTDIWRARSDAAGRWTVENLGTAVNTPGDDYEPLPAPDGSRMILMADGGLYETRKTATGWEPRSKLDAEVNRNGSEIGPVFSPSGRSLLFARDTRGPDSGEFFVWHERGREAWPPDCLAHAPATGQQPLPTVAVPPALARVLADYEAAWRSKDAAALAALFAEDGFVLSSGVPPVRGRAQIQKHYSGKGGALALRALAFATEGSLGYIIGGFARQEGEPDIGKFTLTLRQDAGGRWLIMSDMDNGNARP